ncbi:MAG: 30S ribosomal protein S6 [Chloroflexota bacterium]
MENRDYELIYIVNPEVKDDALTGIMEKVNRFITDKGGTLGKVDQWGRRKLAYHIKRFSEGNYVSTQFKFNPKLTTELEANLKLTEEIIRYLLIRTGEPPPKDDRGDVEAPSSTVVSKVADRG